MNKRLQVIVLILVPLIFLVIGFRFDRTKYSTDPESAYLMNGLNIAMGKAVGHFDNPGTTVQIYSAMALRVTHFARFSGKDLQTDVLLHSEYYIEILRKGMIVINALLLLFLGVMAMTITGNFWIALLLQVAPFMSVTLMEECFTKVAPEQFLFAVTAVLIIMLLKYRISAGPKARKYPFWFGLLAGFGLATKMTFLPMLLIPFIVLTGNRNKWLYVMAIIPAFVLFTIPAISGYPHMVYWFLNLGSHTGTYGQGSQGIIDPAMYIHSLMDIVKNNKAMVAVLAMGSLVLFFRFLNTRNQKRSGPGKVFMMLMAVLIAQFASILMVAKHYHNNHYLFPALSLTGFVLLLLYMLIRENAEGKGLNLLKYSSPFVVAVVIGFSLLNIPYLSLAYKGYRMSNQSTDAAVDRLSRDYKDYVKVYYYPTSFNVYSSLRWGNVYSRQYSNDKLMELFPEGLFYNVWDKTFQWWETNITTRDFVRKYGGKILLVGGPLTNEEFIKTEQSGLKLRKLFDSRVQAVFEIDTAQSPMFKGIARNSPAKFSVQTDFETISTDGQWMMSDNGAAFCKNSDIMTDKSRSGKHAIRLPDLDSYGMKYDLQDVKPGNSYELSIWQLGGGQNVFMVASAENPDQFYVQSKGYVETDSKGWRKMILDFDIPQGFKGNKLKVYLWNHGRSIVWFDDFLITGY